MKNLRMPVTTGEPMAITEIGLNSIIQVDFKTALEKHAALLSRGENMPGANLTTIQDRRAIISLIGPIFHYKNFLTEVFGYPSSEQVLGDLKAAQANPGIEEIILYVDSPGGQVGGLSDVAAYIQGFVTKPIVAHVGDLCASAAYWIASAADSIIAAPTAEIGSIGVVLSARRKSDNQIEIVSSASPKKRPDPATDAGRAVLQARADALAELFADVVAENRGLTRGYIESLEGDIFVAQKAFDLGLIDAIGNLESTVSGKIGEMPVKRQAPKADFMELVDALVKKEGCKRSEAMGKVVAEHPHIYKAWLMDQQPGGAKAGARPTPPADPAPGKRQAGFMELVDAYQAAHNCKRSEAISAMVSAHPDSHQTWLLAQQN